MKTSWHLQFDLNAGPIPYAVLEHAAWHDEGILATGDIRVPPGNAEGTLSYTAQKALTDSFRAINEDHETILFAGGVATVRTTDPTFSRMRTQPLATSPNPHLLHRPTSPFQTLEGFTTADPGNYTLLLNISNPLTQNVMIDRYLEILHENDWDGLMFDNVGPLPYLDWTISPTRFNCPLGVQEGAAHTRVWWEQALDSFLARTRYRLEQEGKKLICVGLTPGPYNPAEPSTQWLGSANSNVADKSSGLIFESPHRIHGNPGFLEYTLKACQAVTNKRRNLFWSCTPQMYTYYPPEPPPDISNDSILHRQAMTAAFLLIHEPPYTSIGYNPYGPYQAWTSLPVTPPPAQPYVHWEPDLWSIPDQLGAPVPPFTYTTFPAPAAPAPNGRVYVREFDRGWVLYNPGNNRLQFQFPGSAPFPNYRLWDPISGALIVPNSVGLINVEPYQGWVLWRI